MEIQLSRDEAIELCQSIEMGGGTIEGTGNMMQFNLSKPLKSLYSKLEVALVRNAKSSAPTTTRPSNQTIPGPRPSKPRAKGIHKPK